MKLQNRHNNKGNEKKINRTINSILKDNSNISIHGFFKYKGILFTKRAEDSVILDSEFKIADLAKSELPWYKKIYISENRMSEYIKNYRNKRIYKACGLMNRKDSETYWIEIRNIDNSFRSQSGYLKCKGSKEQNRKEILTYVKRTIKQITTS